jgi:glycosyltransferase involved in cell wall biosynthesis
VERVTGGKVLFVAPVMPAAHGNGLAMRAHLFVEGFSRSRSVEVIVAGGSRDDPDDLRVRLSNRRDRERVQLLEPRPSLSAGLTLASARELAQRAGGFALVHVMRLYLAPLLDALLDAPGAPRLSVDLDDLDADLFAAAGASDEAEAFIRLERYYVPRLDGVCVAAPRDRDRLARRTDDASVVCLPNAVVAPATLPHGGSRYDLLFVGNLSYEPNIDAALWLCEEILPRLPGLRVAIAGHAPPAGLRARASSAGVTVIGDPASVAPLYAETELVVVPLRRGSGTPIKAIEALAHERTLVATSAGAAGLPLGLVAVADGAAEFADHCRSLLRDDVRRGERARAGRDYVLAERTVDVVAAQVDQWASSILAP